jgi:hypothetical protein
MWPDDGILDASTLLDKTTLAQNGIDDLCAGLYLAVISNHRRVINFRCCG